MVAFWAAAALLLSAQQAWAATVMSTYVGVRGLLIINVVAWHFLAPAPMESFASSKLTNPYCMSPAATRDGAPAHEHEAQCILC